MRKTGLLSSFFDSISMRVAKYLSYRASSTPYRGQAYDQETVRAIIDCIATHAAKAEAMHVIVDKDDRVKEIKRDSSYVRLLNAKPNPIMSGFDLKYKLISQLEDRNTSLAFIDWDGVKPRAIIPIMYTQFEFFQVQGGGYAVQFIDYDGRQYTLNIEDVVVLRKHFNKNEVAGDSNRPIYNTLDMIKASDEGLIEALAVSNKVRGLLKQKKAMLSPKDVEKSQDDFRERYRKAAEDGGIVGIDSMEDYTPLNPSNVFATNAAQQKEIKNNLYSYWRVCLSILTSDYTESQWKAFFEGVVEPLLIMMGQAFTNVCFTPLEYAHGNRIIFNSSVLMNASTQTKVNLIAATKEIGLFTANEYRGLFGYAPVVGGDERLVSLNYVKSTDQSKYQTGVQGNGEQQETGNDGGGGDQMLEA